VTKQKRSRPAKRFAGTPKAPMAKAGSLSGKAGLPRPIGGIPDLIGNIIAVLAADPRLPSSRSATTRAALRDAVLEGFSTADVHRTWLAEIDRIACNTNNIQDLRSAIAAYLRQAGIERLTEFTDETRFVLVQGNGSGTCEVIQPAYIDGVTQRTILAGRARRQQATNQEPAVSAINRQIGAKPVGRQRRRGGSADELRD
jgi:hypothetical protein